MSDINEVQKVAPVASSVKPVVKAAKELTLEEIQKETASKELEIARLKLIEQEAVITDLKARAEARELEIQERKANLTDLKERLDERQLKRQSRDQVFRGHGQNLKQDAINRAAKQEACNHRKGGDGAAGVIGGQGDDMQYAIALHIMGNGDTWVRCLRCGKLWKPPVKSQHATVESYNAAMAIYKESLKFPTRNHTSGTHTFQWGEVINAQGQKEGGAEHYREKMKNVTLD
jgi:hypothetical protein